MGCTILIVDDSATTRGMIKKIIRMSGLEVDSVLEAAHGRAALELLAAQPVQLILADLHMPEMTGVELTQRVLAAPATRDVPVVIISAEPNAERIAQLREQGIRGYLRKPFTPEQLRNVVQDVLQVAHA